MKLKLSLLTLITSAVVTQISCADSTPPTICNGSFEKPCIVQDKKNNSDDIKNYRDTSMMASAYQGDITGLKDLWMSGSAVPTQHNFTAIMKNIKAVAGSKLTQVIDLDLRQEDHGYLNGAPITLATTTNWINVGKTHEEAVASEQTWLQSLSQSNIIDDVLTSDEFKQGDFDDGKDVIIKTIDSEETLASQSGYQYHRLTVTDHLSPEPMEVDNFVALVRQLPQGTWIHMHCRGGKGRTTTFLAMYDMLQNADKVSLDDIIGRQASVEPFYNLYDVDDSDPGKKQGFEDRVAFLKAFYQFAQDNKHGYTGSWSDWLVQHHIVSPVTPIG